GYFSSGWLADRFGAQRVTIVAVGLLVLCQLAFLYPGLPLPLLWVLFALFGYAGSFNVVMLAQVRGLFPVHMSGRAITAVNMFGFAGTALLQWWMGLIINMFAPDAQGHYPVAAYSAAFAFTAVGTALVMAWYMTLPRPRTVSPATQSVAD
ncbi:MAG TPA: MFS transporter, partial [Roseiflexaceae bacterium]|nr:MFS transporter [Roseiflexaceae bacterium]